MQQKHGPERSQKRADPKGGIDHQIHVPTHARRDQFIDGRVDGCIFTADPRASQAPKQAKAKEIPGKRGRGGGY